MIKTILCSILFLLTATSGQAQRLVIGEKAPDIRVSEWLNNRAPASMDKAILIDFFHSSNEQCVKELDIVNELNKTYGNRMNFIVVTRESLDKVTPFVNGKGYGFYIGTDGEGKTFGNYAVRFVPFSVLIDARGRLVWTGNLSSLTKDTIEKALK